MWEFFQVRFTMFHVVDVISLLDIVLYGIKLYILYDLIVWLLLYDVHWKEQSSKNKYKSSCPALLDRKGATIFTTIFFANSTKSHGSSVDLSPHSCEKAARFHPSRPCSSVGTWVRKEPKRKGMKTWKGKEQHVQNSWKFKCLIDLYYPLLVSTEWRICYLHSNPTATSSLPTRQHHSKCSSHSPYSVQRGFWLAFCGSACFLRAVQCPEYVNIQWKGWHWLFPYNIQKIKSMTWTNIVRRYWHEYFYKYTVNIMFCLHMLRIVAGFEWM